MSCLKSNNFLNKANSKFLFQNSYEWLLLFSKPTNTSTKFELFQELNIFIDSNVVLAEKISNYNYILEHIYKLRPQSRVILSDFATWSYKDGFTSIDKTILSWKRHKFNGDILKTGRVVMYNSSYEHLDDNRYKDVDTLTKINIVPNIALADYLNATNVIMHVPNFYPRASEGPSNNTLMGLLLSNSIDTAGSATYCHKSWSHFAVCVSSLGKAETFFVFRKPPLSYVKNIFILPFSVDLWLTNIAFILISSILLYIIVKWEWRLIENNEEILESDMMPNRFSDALLFSIGGVCQQGYDTEPKGSPGKILILTLFLTLIFLFTAYTAYTVVLFQATADDIKTLEDLYNSKMELGIDIKPYFKILFEKQDDPLRKKIYQERILHNSDGPHLYDLAVGLKRVREEYFAFYIGAATGYKQIQNTFFENEKCSLQEINYIDKHVLWTMSPKNTSFLEHLRIGNARISEVGIFNREHLRRMTNKPSCNSQENSYRSAGLLDLYSIYMLEIIGVATSIGLMILENIICKLTLAKN